MRRLPPLPALRAFEAAARLGSFAAAATELSLTPSAISHQVRALEAWFGRALFVRNARRVDLTEEGRRLQGDLTQAFDLIHESCAVLRPSALRRELAVHCAPSFAAKWLSPRIAAFMRAHPAITLRLTSSAQAPDLRHDRTLQVAITYGAPSPQPAVEVQGLGMEWTVPMCAPRLLMSGSGRNPRDVVRLPLIESKLNPLQWADWCRMNRVRLPDAARPSFDRGSLAVAAAADGVGVALESVRFAQAELARGDLVVLDGPAFRRVERETHFLSWRRDERALPALQSFREWMLGELEKPQAATQARGEMVQAGG
jgi:LysR family transcriptional regulator, glycine cleavage system transcriptional activator